MVLGLPLLNGLFAVLLVAAQPGSGRGAAPIPVKEEREAHVLKKDWRWKYATTRAVVSVDE